VWRVRALRAWRHAHLWSPQQGAGCARACAARGAIKNSHIATATSSQQLRSLNLRARRCPAAMPPRAASPAKKGAKGGKDAAPAAPTGPSAEELVRTVSLSV
jgi:hypothetical protein